jgi:hypothetical protein
MKKTNSLGGIKMFKKWANKRGYTNIFYFIIGKKSPSLWHWRGMKKYKR